MAASSSADELVPVLRGAGRVKSLKKASSSSMPKAGDMTGVFWGMRQSWRDGGLFPRNRGLQYVVDPVSRGVVSRGVLKVYV
jgi:hypothetical protein